MEENNLSRKFKKATGKNLLKQCLVNLQKQFSAKKSFVDDVDIYKSEFDFTCPSASIGMQKYVSKISSKQK
jgi:hypothetical protein